LEDLRERWLDKRIALRTLSQTFPEAIKKLKGTADAHYNPEHFGGADAKRAVTKWAEDAEDALYDAVVKASITLKPPCYVCLVQATHQRASKVAQKCVGLIEAVNKNPDVVEDREFNCDKIKNFTRNDMEGLNEAYWDKAIRYQDNLQESLDSGIAQQIRRDLRKLRDLLQEFVDFQAGHPGNADQFKQDLAAVGDRCTLGTKTVMFRLVQ
jgi:hypothetical protein